ncbi:lysosome-associated membrane glycoprotein 3 isoform X2 [Thamnophis elegans]|uniref:lysosome-associated membrane glycoprotein 3 isoform X2 n=1 Tax=Thamnophis elegans TaxID=35005 RepID=UPI0013789088|nr:lysosome-associated membrane glycoprotein 3 isoform X2 [Thamnophis elegans]
MWKPFIEFLLITAGVFSCTAHVLDEEAAGGTTLQPTSFLQRAPFPPSSSQATIPPYHHSQALANQSLGHGTERGIPPAPTAEMLKAESIPLTKSQAVEKPTTAARTTLLPSEPQTDWTRTHKTGTATQETTSTLPLSARRKKETPVPSRTKEHVDKTVSGTTQQHTTKLRTHTTLVQTSFATHKSVSSSPMPTSQTGPALALQPSPAVTGAYSVSNGTADCIKALTGLTMILINTKTGELQYFNVDPNTTHTTGYCGYGQSMLNISFEGGFVHFIFTKKENIYYISMIEAALTVLSQGLEYNGIKNDQLFSTAVGNSFKCLSKQTVDLASNFQLQAANSQLQAFDIVNNQFGKEEECTLDRNKKWIPAAIGFSLSGLVIIILFSCVLYRRKPESGYSRI